MTWLDVAILVIIALSAVVSFWRGFIKEALSLAAWVLSFWVAITFSPRLAMVPWVVSHIESPTIRLVVAFAVLFFLTLLAGALVNYLVGRLVRKTGLSSTDRTLGILFGVGRGVLLVGVLVLLAGMTELPNESWWDRSRFMDQFQTLAIWMKGLLPTDVQHSFRY